MWTLAEIEELNPAGVRQKASILSHLLKIGAAWPQLLCDSAGDLEEYGSPYVCCFTQLPFPVCVERGKYRLAGLTKGVHIEFDFRLFSVGLNQKCELMLTDLPKTASNEHPIGAPVGTQVRAFVQLWGRRVSYHNNYLKTFGNSGPKAAIINPTRSKWSPGGGRYAGNILTSHTYEAQLASRLQTEIHTGLLRFLSNYSLLALEELPQLPYLYGYLVMPAPGRLTHSEPPRSILTAMMRASPIVPVSQAQVAQALAHGFRGCP